MAMKNNDKICIFSSSTNQTVYFSHGVKKYLSTVFFVRARLMLYALCLSYHSNTEAVLFACLS